MLATLMFFLSVWGLVHSLGFVFTGSTFLYVLEQIALLPLAPLWLVTTIQHTGRGRWLTW